MCDMIKDLSLDNSGPQVDKVPKGGGVSFPEGKGCQFFPPGGEVSLASTEKKSLRRSLDLKQMFFTLYLFESVSLAKNS